ncbi:MAG TPA: alpha-L-arabinofuranosidase C-terminal domain-containing protein [Balneolales bacterium]|nr:alpha-L-arabinofuranosidase C-terminal domain-containing protein [Balneolales bacterium]
MTKKTITVFTSSLLVFCTMCIIFAPDLRAQNTSARDLSPKEIVSKGHTPQGWMRDSWTDTLNYFTTKSSRSDKIDLVIQSDSLVHDRFFKNVHFQPNSTYELSYWMKTDNVTGKRSKAGAGVSVGSGTGFKITNTNFDLRKSISGTKNWTHQIITFHTKDEDSMVLSFLLGKNGAAKGTVTIDDITLKQVSHTPFKPAITVHLDQKRTPMSPYIYGQFMEHVGRSIYGGVWAEMLQDRKFYFMPGTQKSPWTFSGSKGALVIDSTNAYVGKYSPELHSTDSNKAGLQQGYLGLKNGDSYIGHIVMAGSPSSLPVDIILSWGDKPSQKEVVKINRIDYNYKSYPFTFHDVKGSKNGTLTIKPEGKGYVEIGTLSLMPASNINGFRSDVISLMKQLNSPVYRWPGGNFVSGYNWKDGIGKRDKRPPKIDRAWVNSYRKNPWRAVEPNDVGIDEFMQLCKILHTKAYIALNTGLGNANLAAQEVQYLNGSAKKSMGKWRAENGHPKPYNVKFFAVGNEMFGSWQLGHMPENKYVKKNNRVAKAVWSVDPSAKLVAVGSGNRWNKEMFQYSSKYMNYISEHFYRQDWLGKGLMTHIMQIPHAIHDIAAGQRKMNHDLPELKNHPVKIAMDEWNYWYGPHIYGVLGTRYFLRDALGIAAGINAYSRNSDIVFMANYAQTVNVIGAIKATKTTSFMAATGVVLATYRKEFGTQPVETTGEKLPFDIASSLTKDHKYLTISVVNTTDKDQKLPVTITGGNVKKSGLMYYITGKNSMVYNLPGKQAVRTRQKTVHLGNELTIPKMSACIFRFPVLK